MKHPFSYRLTWRFVLVAIYLALLPVPLLLNALGYNVSLSSDSTRKLPVANSSGGGSGLSMGYPGAAPSTLYWWSASCVHGRGILTSSDSGDVLVIQGESPAVDFTMLGLRFQLEKPSTNLPFTPPYWFRHFHGAGYRILVFPYVLNVLFLALPAIAWLILSVRKTRAERRRQQFLVEAMEEPA